MIHQHINRKTHNKKSRQNYINFTPNRFISTWTISDSESSSEDIEIERSEKICDIHRRKFYLGYCFLYVFLDMVGTTNAMIFRKHKKLVSSNLQ